MTGIFSSSAGVLYLPKSGIDKYTVFDLIGGEEKDPIEAQYIYSAAQDWEEIESTDADTLLETATREYWLQRTISLLQLAINGLEKSIEKEVLEHVEELLSSRVSSETVLDCLLVAPLAETSHSVALAKSALSHGFSAVAAILDELVDLQALLHRLTDIWLRLPKTVFSNFSESKEMIWVTVVEKFGIKQLLCAGSKRDFTSKWNLLAYCFTIPQSRLGVSVLGQELSRLLFPYEEEQQEEIMTTPITQEVRYKPSAHLDYAVKDHEAYERVKKQISTIAQLVSRGHDVKAGKFLIELIEQQTSLLGGESYAVKTLCNIAQLCADMFRMDFEKLCLDKARELDPSDSWALIQYGDHLKRVGKYDEALVVFAQAKQLGENIVAESSIADVYSQQGDYEKAIHTYENIPNWEGIPEVLTAIADNLRKMGRMEEARTAYEKLVYSVEQEFQVYSDLTVRAQAGIAEIAKRQGKLENALHIYEGILKQEEIDDQALIVYKLSLCNVLKLMDRYDDAYSIADEVIREYPFAMQARFARGSILGLIGKELEGLDDLPESSSSAI